MDPQYILITLYVPIQFRIRTITVFYTATFVPAVHHHTVTVVVMLTLAKLSLHCRKNNRHNCEKDIKNIILNKYFSCLLN